MSLPTGQDDDIEYVIKKIKAMLNNGAKNFSVSRSVLKHHTANTLAIQFKLYCVYSYPSAQYDFSLYPLRVRDTRLQVLIR
jgi:hypothetical protein